MNKFSFFLLFFLSILLLGLFGGFAAPVLAGAQMGDVETAHLDEMDLLPSPSTFTTVNASSGDVQIQTIPPLLGVTFQINGQKLFSDANGFASIHISEPGLYRLYILTDEYKNPSQRIEFGRWLGEAYELYRDVKVPNPRPIQVGLNVFDLVSQSFTDLKGVPIDTNRVQEFTIRSTQGDLFTFEDGRPHWIPASRVTRRIGGLQAVKLLYSVLNVTVDGSNVVNQSQQRFYAEPNSVWPISLLFYSLRISTRDAMFGSPVMGAVNIEFPDGHTKNYPLDNAGMVEIDSLARGDYFMELTNISGISNRVPVALSRTQEVSTSVITYLDLIVLGLTAVLVMVGLLVYGRPWLVTSLLKNKQPIKESQPFLEM
jgi:hypothetical protein